MAIKRLRKERINMLKKEFINKEQLAFVNKKATWFVKLSSLLKMLDADKSKVHNFPFIKKENYEGLGQKEQTELLKRMLVGILKYLQLNPNSQNLICPFHQDFNPSMQLDTKKHNLHCYGCMDAGKHTDIYDIILIVFGIESFAKQKQMAIKLFVENGEEIADYMEVKYKDSNYNNSKMTTPKAADKVLSGRVYIPAEFDKDCIAYLETRGISVEIAKKFKLKTWEYKKNKYLIIPCVNGYNVRRLYKNGEGSCTKFWNKKDTPVTLFNDDVFESAAEGEAIFCFESAIDAMTVSVLADTIDIKVNAVATNGIENSDNLLNKVDLILGKKLKTILWYDSDDAGFKAAIKMSRQLEDLNVNSFLLNFRQHKFWRDNIFCRTKDLNEAFVKDKLETEEDFLEVINSAVFIYDNRFMAKGRQPTMEETLASVANLEIRDAEKDTSKE